MGNSLRDQLLKAGLVNKSKVQQAKKQSRKKKRAKGGEPDRIQQAVNQAQQEKAARDRELNRQKEIKQAAKARQGLLKDFVAKNKLNDPKAEDPFNFVHDGAVKRLHVNEKQRERLAAGQLSIVFAADRYYLVETAVADKMADMSPGLFVFKAEAEKPEEDDPYADYQVPDDLMW